MKRSFTTLTEATLITAVVQHGYGEIITDALLEVGIQGSTVHGAMGVGCLLYTSPSPRDEL